VIDCAMGRAFVPFSIELGQDWATLQPDLAKLISDGRDTLDATQFLTGTGTDSPAGVLTGLSTTQRVQSAGAGAIAIGDVYALKQALPARFMPNAVWAMHPTRVDAEPADRVFLDRVRTAIEANLGDENFNVERLAGDVAQSRGNLHRRLRDLIGESPSDLIRRMRLERAGQLLEADAGSVAEVAYAVGFKSVAHFSNAFHELHGVRPSGWRERVLSRSGVRLGSES